MSLGSYKLSVKYFLFLVCLGLTSCNHDGFIEQNDPSGGRRPTTMSKASCDKVYQYMPAPGQFVNDATTMKSEINSPTEAAAWAQSRLTEGSLVPLGAFGGYVVVGFDHSITNSGDYDFGVAGNAFVTTASQGSSNEPGVVYVMQDSNGNGLPDDIWYELLGSESLAESTIRNYEITYYRPIAAEQDVRWTDNCGNEGVVSYMKAFHDQAYYYPMWIDGDSYTLSGTCLAPKTEQNDETSNWLNEPYGWGYADNVGADNVKKGKTQQLNRFKISDAVGADLKPVNLKYIDFVKIQTGVNASSGWLGEISTEVCGVYDLSLMD